MWLDFFDKSLALQHSDYLLKMIFKSPEESEIFRFENYASSDVFFGLKFLSFFSTLLDFSIHYDYP